MTRAREILEGEVEAQVTEQDQYTPEGSLEEEDLVVMEVEAEEEEVVVAEGDVDFGIRDVNVVIICVQ